MRAPIVRGAVLALVLLLGLVARVGNAHADVSEADAMNAARRVLVVLRILAYDKDLPARIASDDVPILVVSTAAPQNRAERATWQAGFAMLPKVKVAGRSVRVIAIDFDNERAFDQAVATHRPAAVIIAGELAGELAAIRRVSRARHAVSFSTRERDVAAGVAVAVIPSDRRDEIVINLGAARAEGARFGAGLLQLARVVAE